MSFYIFSFQLEGARSHALSNTLLYDDYHTMMAIIDANDEMNSKLHITIYGQPIL